MSLSLQLARSITGSPLGGVPMRPTATSVAITRTTPPPIALHPTDSFIGSLLGGIGKVATGIAGSLPIVGGAVQGIETLFGGHHSSPPPSGSGGVVLGPGAASGGTITLPGGISISGGGGISLGGGAGGGSFGSGVPATTPGTALATCTPRGYHLNKRGYYTAHGYVAPHTKLVRNRRRNDLNGRALNRALSRVEGYEHVRHRVERALNKIARGRGVHHRSAAAPRGKKCR